MLIVYVCTPTFPYVERTECASEAEVRVALKRGQIVSNKEGKSIYLRVVEVRDEHGVIQPQFNLPP
jgi:hypothetical protein